MQPLQSSGKAPTKTRTKAETEALYPPKAKYAPKQVNPPNGIKTVDSDNPATKIGMRP